MKRLWVIVIGVMVAILLHNLSDYWQTTASSINAETRSENTISYYFSDFNSVRTDPSGQPIYQLQGKHLAHRDQRQESTITAPLITQEALTTTHSSTLSARKALIDHQDDRMELTDDVYYQKIQGINNTLNLKTDTLEYRPTEQRLQTDSAVLMTDKSTVVQSTGMTAHINDDNLELHSNVRTTYETQ